MIIKERTVPIELMQLEVLNERLAETHIAKELVKADLGRQMAGYKGEINLNYPLSFLSSEEFLILHHVRLFDGTHYFQIDTLIITVKFILIVETKNMTGTLYFDTEFNQLIRRNENGEVAFSDPLLQVKRHKAQISKWMSTLTSTHLPIESLVVISNPRTIIRSSSTTVHQKVIHNGQLPFQIAALQEKYKRKILQKEEALKLANEIARKHCPLEVDILKKYGIKPKELIRGVKCLTCGCFPCKRAYGKWICRNCGAESKEAHIATLREYALLFGTEVTNGDIRNFLEIDSSSTVNKLLAKMNLPFKGEKRWRAYSLKGLKKPNL
ncbi:NERD domain-containing protein [Rossellomorea vietnamensis]|uniref:NERD domain-containing protein n=1 Tax=Rossellomorea vietnamensis TaxID=218284 RepID=A0A5D4MDJ4_9BACI|nr:MULTISPECIES: nuclease-related domain-containing protein [Bacillaceae]TYR99050.1 NERD domain-containing protein [Rossellomorea vietnamensis]